MGFHSLTRVYYIVIVASTKGAVLLFTTSEFEYRSRAAGASPFVVSQ